MHSILKDLSCSFLPGKIAPCEVVPPLYNASYDYWRRTWGEIFLKAGSPSSLNVENFLRQNILIILHQDNNIAGLLTICFFNLNADSSFDHPYFQPFPKDLIQKYKEQRSGFSSTFEYLSIHPEFRRNKISISLSEVLIGLGLKISLTLDAKITLATSVRPARVHESGEKFGWAEAGSVTKYGLDCLLLYNTPELIRTHPDKDIVSLIDSFWKNRNDLTEFTNQTDIFRRTA